MASIIQHYNTSRDVYTYLTPKPNLKAVPHQSYGTGTTRVLLQSLADFKKLTRFTLIRSQVCSVLSMDRI